LCAAIVAGGYSPSVTVFRRFSRRIERLNRWLAQVALASQVEPGGGVTGGQSPVNTVGVNAVLTEIGQESDAGKQSKHS
jgi:hypothetical protein